MYTSPQGDSTEYRQGLTACELRIFNEGQDAASDILRWRVGQSSRLEASSLLRKKLRDDQVNDAGSSKRTRA
jgi:hypothetical protein